MPIEQAFLVEEVGEGSKLDEAGSRKAFYSGKFNEYIITKSHSLKNTLVITDIISGRDAVDAINSSIKELVFRDCVKTFSELYKIEDVPFEVVEHRNFSYKFSENIKIYDNIIKSIKIFINGYDENSDSVSLDLTMLGENSEYKYKIAGSTIEMTMTVNMSVGFVEGFLDTFIYKNLSEKSSAREIYVIVNDKLVYKTRIEI